MPLFDYTIIDPAGNEHQGRRSAATAEELAAQLQREGHTPLDIYLVGQSEKKPEASIRLPSIFKEKVSKDALHMFCRQMHAVLKAGIPVGSAVSRLAESTTDKPLREALSVILANLNEGKTLSASMAQHPEIFSDFFTNLVKVGETSGALDQVFLHLADYLQLDIDTMKRIKTAFRYPTIVLVATFVALMIINFFVIPAFSRMFGTFHAQLPLPTRIIMGTSDFLIHDWYWLLGAFLAAAFAFRTYVKTEKGALNWAKFQLKIPIIGWIIHRILLNRFTRLYALVLRAGLSAVDGVELVGASTGNIYIAKKIKSVASLISRGNTFSSAVAKTELFPPLIIQMMTLGEETGNVDELLDVVADFYQREIDYDLERLGDAIEPIMLVIMGGIVLILALGVYLPMWSIGNVMLHSSGQ